MGCQNTMIPIDSLKTSSSVTPNSINNDPSTPIAPQPTTNPNNPNQPMPPPTTPLSVPTNGKGGQTGLRSGSCQDGRRFLVYVPSSYRDSTPMPLVAAMHGLGDNYQNFDEIVNYVGWHELADAKGFILLIPDHANPDRESFLSFGTNGSVDLTKTQNRMDSLLGCIYRDIGAKYNIETTQIDWIGFSEGAVFTGIAASYLSQRLHGVALFAGSAPRLNTAARKLPIYYIVGTADYGYSQIAQQSQSWQAYNPLKLTSVNGAPHSFLQLNTAVSPAVTYNWLLENASEPVRSGF